MNINLNLNTGVKPIDINFGELGSGRIYYNPDDTNFFKNLLNLQENIQKRINELKSDDFDIDVFGNPIIPQDCDVEKLSENERQDVLQKIKYQIDIIDKTNKIFYDEIDNIFIGNASEVIFKYCNPLAIINDDFYIKQFFESLGKELKAVLKEKQKKPISNHVKKK